MIGIAAGVQDLHADLARLPRAPPRSPADGAPLRAGSDSLPANGLAQPARFGAMPPLTSSPAPPRARAAKYAASLREIARAIFEPGVHRAHDDAIRQAREAQIERGKQMRYFTVILCDCGEVADT